MNAAQLAVNHPTVAVEVFANDYSQLVSAVTLGNHMVVGVRRWYVQAFDCEVKVSTEAWEARNGTANDIAMNLPWVGGRQVMGSVWHQYLINIGEAYAGEGNFAIHSEYWGHLDAGSQIPFQYDIPGSGVVGPSFPPGYYHGRLDNGNTLEVDFRR